MMNIRTVERMAAFKKRMADFEEMAVTLSEAASKAAAGVFGNWEDGGRTFNVLTSKGRKKYYKAKFKREFPELARRDRKRPPEFVNKFSRMDEEGERKVSVWIFKNAPGIIDKIKYHMDWEADHNHYDYSPTGLWFREEARFHVFGDRVVMVQSAFLDC